MALFFRRVGPTWRFALGALFLVGVLGYVLVSFLSRSIEQSNLDGAAAEARDTVAYRLLVELTPEDMQAPFEGDRLAEFDRFVKDSVVSSRTARVKVWDRAGQVLYADDPAIIGVTFPPGDEYLEALAGKTVAGTTGAAGAENQSEAGFGKLLEVYSPVVFPGSSEPAGVFEIYQDYGPVAHQIGTMRRYVVFTLGGGLAILYAALLAMAQGAWVIRGKTRALVASERKFQELVQSVDAIVWEADGVTGEFTFVNDQAERILGTGANEWLRTPKAWADHIHPEDRAATLATSMEAIAAMRGHVLEYRMVTAEGRVIWLHALVRVECQDGKPVRLRGVMFDITERKKAEDAISRLAAIVASSDDVVIGVDLEGTVATWNAAAEQLTGMAASQVIGTPLGESLPEYRGVVMAALARTAIGERVDPFEITVKASDGRELAMSVSVFAVNGPEGKPVGLASIIRDVTERRQMEEKLAHLASRDGLTGLYNRRRFEEKLERECALAQRMHAHGALLFLDLDGFKGVNDTLGHHAGDELLVGLAGVLHERMRETDILARLGGDEFAVYLHGAGEEDALLVGRELCERIRGYRMVLNGQVVSVTASVGIALLPGHGTRPADLLVRADIAMYRAKEDGRDRVRVYRPDEDAAMEGRAQLTWEQRIRNALAQRRLVFYAQPIRHLGRESNHFELLLRMNGEDGEVILPDAFLPAAERSGLIHEIDRWAVTEAIRLLGRFVGRAASPRYSVNLSAMAFNDEALLPLIERELARSKVDPANLVLEMSETAALVNMEKAGVFIGGLKALGCRFAIDDFGAGASSFSYLKRLPVDYVKIDGSFIQNLAKDSVDRHLVKAMVAVARGLGNQTIAEFVRDEETLQILVGYGVDGAQGSYIGRPAPMEEEGVEGLEDVA